MPERDPITASNIEDICKEFGFPYELRDGEHWAVVDEKETEVKFTKDGSLPRGRHKFKTAAREASPQFREAYQSRGRSSANSGPNAGVGAGERPSLGKRFLRKYSIAELEKAMELIGEIVDEKNEAEELAKGIEEREGKLAELRQLVKGIEKHKLNSHEQITARISEIKTELKELKER